MEAIKIFAPASVANLNCGFDALGLCLEHVGDEMIFKKSKKLGVRITKIEGADLPSDIHKNVAGIAADSLYKRIKPNFGIEIELYKGILPGSGIGSSSASAVGAVIGVNTLCGNPFERVDLLSHAIDGEAFASGQRHADNVAPALFGGIQLIRDHKTNDILSLPFSSDLRVLVIHPQVEIKTSEARALLPKQIKLKNAVQAWANLGALVHGFHTFDYPLISRAMKDLIVEPYRKSLIPGFDDMKEIALKNGAISFGISGSGPSMFALVNKDSDIDKIQYDWMLKMSEYNLESRQYLSHINAFGAKKMEENAVL